MTTEKLITYTVTRDPDGAKISISHEGCECYRLERESNGRGIWALYRVKDGVQGEKIDRDQYSNDLIEGLNCGLYREGELIQVGEYFLLPVDPGVSDFYISSLGFLCARKPSQIVLSGKSVVKMGITDTSQIAGYASIELKQQAGIEVDFALLLQRTSFN
jgi:hypothetical protein